MARLSTDVPENEPELVEPDQELPPEGEHAIGDLASLGSPDYQDWKWVIYRLRSQAEMARLRTKERRVWVGECSGPINFGQVQSEHGGGVFEFWGFYEGKLRKRPHVELAGPIKSFPTPESFAAPVAAVAAAAAAPAQAGNGFPTEAVLLLQRLVDRVERLETSRAHVPAPQGMTMKDVLALVPILQREPSQPMPADSIKEMVGIFREGIELGRASEPTEQSTTAVVIEKLAPLLQKILEQQFSARRRPQPQPHPQTNPGGQPTVSHAEVVETIEPTPSEIRMGAVVDSLSRAIAEDLDPADMAATIEVVLTAEEVAMLKQSSADQVMESLGEVRERYPLLGDERAKVYVSEVLEALRNPEHPGDGPDSLDG